MDNRTNQVQVQRRAFLKTAATTLAWGGFGAQALAMQDDGGGGIATRPLGRTGERVPIVGLGGYHIGVPEEKEAISIMHEGKGTLNRRTPRQSRPDDESLRS
jgi:hypothetical protein